MRNDAAGAQAARLLRPGPAAPGALAKRLHNDLKNDLANSSDRYATMRLSEPQTQRVQEQTGDRGVPADTSSMPALKQTFDAHNLILDNRQSYEKGKVESTRVYLRGKR